MEDRSLIDATHVAGQQLKQRGADEKEQDVDDVLYIGSSHSHSMQIEKDAPSDEEDNQNFGGMKGCDTTMGTGTLGLAGMSTATVDSSTTTRAKRKCQLKTTGLDLVDMEVSNQDAKTQAIRESVESMYVDQAEGNSSASLKRSRRMRQMPSEDQTIHTHNKKQSQTIVAQAKQEQEAIDRAIARSLQQEQDDESWIDSIPLPPDQCNRGNDASQGLKRSSSDDDVVFVGQSNPSEKVGMKCLLKHNLQESSDYALALSLQYEDESKVAPNPTPMDDECKHMDKAWNLVEWVIDRHKRLASSPKGSTLIDTIGVDDMVFIAKKFVDCVGDFRDKGLDADVTLGFHYTKQENLTQIREDGLMTWEERSAQDSGMSSSRRMGLAFGDGIYVSNNPGAFAHFGPIGIIVAIVKGSHKRVDRNYGLSLRRQLRDNRSKDSYNAVIGNKRNVHVARDEQDYFDEIVLRHSSQVLPLIKYEKITRKNNEPFPDACTSNSLAAYFKEMKKGIGLFFNAPATPEKAKGEKDNVHPWPTAPTNDFATYPYVRQIRGSSYAYPYGLPTTVLAPAGNTHYALSNSLPPHSNQYGSSFAPITNVPSNSAYAPTYPIPGMNTMPLSLSLSGSAVTSGDTLKVSSFTYTAPDNIVSSDGDDLLSAVFVKEGDPLKQCAICLDEMKPNERIARLVGCEHIFHKDCIRASIRQSPRCPICRTYVKEPQGASPSGDLSLTTSRNTCASYEKTSTQTFVLKYSLQGGIQKCYHPNPGTMYYSTKRVAYIPDVPEGRKLLERLIYAFQKGLTFTVGTSLTTGRANSIIWSSIHHKTSPSYGVHGFPDSGYFINCNEELDNLGVPKNPSKMIGPVFANSKPSTPPPLDHGKRIMRGLL